MKAKNKGELHFLWDPRLATLPWRTGHTEHGFRITCGLRAGKGGTGGIKTYYDIWCDELRGRCCRLEQLWPPPGPSWFTQHIMVSDRRCLNMLTVVETDFRKLVVMSTNSVASWSAGRLKKRVYEVDRAGVETSTRQVKGRKKSDFGWAATRRRWCPVAGGGAFRVEWGRSV